MPIQSLDIKILKSDRMDDTSAGGGDITSTQVLGGQSNEIFNDISNLDRTYGAVHLRKIYPSVVIQSQDIYFGAHTILASIPKDNQVNINMFTTNDWHDRRPNASNRVESYLVKGADYNGFLLNTQWQGSKIVTIFQQEDRPIPEVSDVLYLTQNNNSEEQYVKIESLTSDIQSFTVGNVSFKRRVVTIFTTQPLDYDFIGTAITYNDSVIPQATVKTTIVANASKFYSTRPLDQALVSGAVSVKADTVYTQLLPSSVTETAIVDATLNASSVGSFNASTNVVTISSSANFNGGTKLFLGNSPQPGTLIISLSGGGTLTDDGGNLMDNGVVIGSVEYNTGNVLFSPTSPSYTGTKSITFDVAGSTATTTQTAITNITAGNRGNLYNLTLAPKPSKGSVQVSFQVFNNWYNLFDNRAGGLTASDPDIGSGTINYSTGTVSVTLTNQPDVGSAILWRWGNPLSTNNIAD